MISEVMETLDYSSGATIALVLFVLAFAGVLLQLMTTAPQVAKDQGNIPLSEGTRLDQTESKSDKI